MPTYVVLGKWTEQGVRNVKETVRRVEQRNARIEQLGGRVIGRWWTQGAYDAVVVLEMPDDETASALVLSERTAMAYCATVDCSTASSWSSIAATCGPIDCTPSSPPTIVTDPASTPPGRSPVFRYCCRHHQSRRY